MEKQKNMTHISATVPSFSILINIYVYIPSEQIHSFKSRPGPEVKKLFHAQLNWAWNCSCS